MTFTKALSVKRLRLLTLLAAIGLLTAGCNESNDRINPRQSPPGNSYDYDNTDTLSVRIKTVQSESPRADGFTSDMIGAMNDPEFGLMRAAVVTEVRKPVDLTFISSQPSFTFGTLRILVRDTIPGDTTYYARGDDNQTFTIYRATNADAFDTDSLYRTDAFPEYNTAEPLGSWTGQFNQLGQYLNIPLNQTFVDYLNTSTSDDYVSDAAFREFFNGLVIVPEDTNKMPGEGGLLYVNLEADSSRLIVGIGDDTTTDTAEFVIDAGALRYNVASYDRTATPLQTALDAGIDAEYAYLQPFGGTELQIDFPGLRQLLNSLGPDERIIIHEAELKLPLADDKITDQYPAAPILLTFDRKDDLFVQDVFETYYGGRIVDGAYIIRLTRYIQQALNQAEQAPDYEPVGLDIVLPEDRPDNLTPRIANRTVIRLKEQNNIPLVKLTIKFSKIET